jgi:hypothetical protein
MDHRSLKEALLAAKTPPSERVALPELGNGYVVTVRGMTGVERDAFEACCFKGKGRHRDFNMANMRAKLVAYCCIDESGQRVFSDADADALGQVRADLLDRLFGVAQRLSGMREEDVEELGLASPSPTPSPTSPSASLSNSG